ncbi:unnamed protein product, partial [Ectocarpus sp. 8 AP-2014]
MNVTGDPPEESEPEVQYRGKLVVRTHRRLSSHSSGRSDAGSPASYIGSRSNAGSPASYMASRGNAGSPESLTAAGSNAGSPASSLAAGSPNDEPEPEIVRQGKVVIRSHRNLAPLGTSQVVTLPGKGQQQMNTLSMDISPPRSLAPRPEEDDSDGRKTRDPAATASAREISASETSDKDSGDGNSGPTKLEEVSAVGASDKCDGSSSSTKREDMSDVGASGKDSGDDNSGPTKPEEVSAVGASDKDSGDGSSSSTKREDMSDVGASGKDSGDDNSGPTKREDMSDVGDSDKDSGGDSESPIKAPAEVRVEAADVLDLRVFCGTWNVAGRKLDSAEDMGLWLDVDKLDEEGDTSVPPDIFVIGFQEVVELSAQNVVMDSFLDTQSRTNSLQWFTHVYAYLAQYGERYGVRYAMVTEQRLLGTYMLIMAKEDLCPKIANVQTAVVPTGLG